MQRFICFLGALTILLGVGGSASAGYWEVQYDLAGSTVVTTVPAAGTSDVDPLTGSLTIQYDTSLGTPSAAVTAARLVAGNTTVFMNQTNGGLFTLTGTTTTNLSPPLPGGIAGSVTLPKTISITGVPNTVTGFIHCYNGAFNCTMAGTAFTNSVPVPQTSLGPWNLGKVVFASVPGSGNFAGTGVVVTVPGTPPVFVTTTYVGAQISRIFKGASVPAGSNATRIGLGLFLLLGGASGLALQRSRRTRQAG